MARTEASHWSRFDTDGPTAEDGSRLCPCRGHSSTRKPPTQNTKKTRWLSASLPPPPPSSALRSWPSPPPSAAPLGTFAGFADARDCSKILFFLRGWCDLARRDGARANRARATSRRARGASQPARGTSPSVIPALERSSASRARRGDREPRRGYARGSSHLAVARGRGTDRYRARAWVASASSRASDVDPARPAGSPLPLRRVARRRSAARSARAPRALPARSVGESASDRVVDRSSSLGFRLL